MSFKSIFILFFICGLTLLAQGQSQLVEVSKTNTGANISFNKYTLPNGLTVLFHKTEAFGEAVHVEVKYHVGSAREQKGKSGFAHLFEHLMFQGSKHVKDDEHFKLVQDNGGDMNGTTNSDRTNYYETVPSNVLETALWLEADRMGFLLDSMSQSKLDNQREVVKNERLQRYDNKPYGLMNIDFNKYFYPEGHPYFNPTIGSMEDLNQASLQDAQSFFLRWYGPNNASLAVVGDFDEQDALKWIEQYFGEIKPGPVVYTDKQIPIEFEEDQIILGEENVPLPVLRIAFPTVDFNHDDYLPLQALAYVLSGNKSSFITKNIEDKGFAQNAYAFQQSKELAGMFQFYFKTPSTQSLMVIESLWKASLLEFEKKGATLVQFEGFKAQKANEIKSRGSSLNAISRTLTFGEIFKNNPNYSHEELEKLNNLSYNSIERVYNQYIKNKPALYQAIYPKGKKESWSGVKKAKKQTPLKKFINKAEYDTLSLRTINSQINRNIHPEIKSSKPKSVFKFKEESWKNGIDLIYAINYMSKINRVDFHFSAGKRNEKNGQFGLVDVLTDLFKEGSINFPAKEFYDKLEMMGSSLSISSNYDELTFHLKANDKFMNESIALVFELVNNPAFNQKDFDRIRLKKIEHLKSQLKNPSYMSNSGFKQSVYGPESALAYPLGKLEDLERLKLNDVKRYYREQIGARDTRIVYTGRLPIKAYKKAFSNFKMWSKFKAQDPVIQYPETTRAQIYIIDKPNAPQIKIAMGKFVGMYDRYSDAYPLYQLSQIPFGGQFSSRLNMNLREDKGYTYGVRSSFTGSGIENVFKISSSVVADKLGESLDEIINEVERIKDGGLTTVETNQIVDQYFSKTSLQMVSLAKKHQILNRIQKRGLSKKAYKKWYKKLSKFDTYDFSSYLRTLLDINNYSIVLVGDKTQIKQELQWMNNELIQSANIVTKSKAGKTSKNIWPDSRKTKIIKGVEYPVYKAKDFNSAFKQAKKELGVSKKAKFIWNNSIYTTSVK